MIPSTNRLAMGALQSNRFRYDQVGVVVSYHASFDNIQFICEEAES